MALVELPVTPVMKAILSKKKESSLVKQKGGILSQIEIREKNIEKLKKNLALVEEAIAEK